ncbi:MAG: hypothetical protein LUE21_02750 [Oscillospiraceae bacterium]|nr:hypothetical protein [Oscillospiraceae bacterium]
MNQDEKSKMLYQSAWLVEKTVSFSELTIRERAEIFAPEGKQVTLIENGIVRDMKPGTYRGKVTLAVSDVYYAEPEGLMVFNEIHAPIYPAICVVDGKLDSAKSIPAAVWGGAYSEKGADGIYIGACAESFSGILLDSSDYTINNVRMDLTGFGRNDYAGCDTGVSIWGDSHVEINDSTFNMSGVTRCAIHVSGDSRVKVNNCDIINFAPVSDWIGRFCWSVSLRGANRLCQLAGNGQVEYNNCRLKTNGWGVLSIDGSDEFVDLYVRDSIMELSGPNAHGYGVFCIGPNRVTLDHTVADVYGFPMLFMGMEGKGCPSIINGSVIKGRRFGALAFSDDNSIFTIKDSVFRTGKSNIVLKASITRIDIDNSVMESGNNVLLQLMDSDECGMDILKFHLPIGETDTPIEGRDITTATEKDDVILNLSNMSVTGDVYNSTTNLNAYKTAEHGGMGVFHDTLVGPVGFTGAEDDPESSEGHTMEQKMGPKNLGVNAVNAHITGVISSATQSYPEGVTEITPDNWFDISNITQEAAKPVNNGVVVSLDQNSSWTVTGKSYITRLILAEGAQLKGCDGRGVSVSVNGKKVDAAPGEYVGMIEISPV